MGWEARSDRKYEGSQHGEPFSCSRQRKGHVVGPTKRPGVSTTSASVPVKTEKKRKR